MLALVRAMGTDSVLGEEVGNQPGSSNRRWILDGIDGTHNYADGRPGWGTIIALDIDGTVELGMVSAPLWGRRWWAVRGAGAWSAGYAKDGSFDAVAAEPLRCGGETSLAAFDNEVPSRHHVHTVVRTPNGGDYGADLLRQHHEQFDHRDGHHHARH
jgi:fructose-1,6-bisphosphatase/inositol monophosphatase family enzyme